jgi:hypothetical protein
MRESMVGHRTRNEAARSPFNAWLVCKHQLAPAYEAIAVWRWGRKYTQFAMAKFER